MYWSIVIQADAKNSMSLYILLCSGGVQLGILVLSPSPPPPTSPFPGA